MIALILAALAAASPHPPDSAAPHTTEQRRRASPSEQWIERNEATVLEAKRLYEQNDYRGAIRLLEPLAADDAMPDWARAWLASCYKEAGDYAAAIAVYRKLLAVAGTGHVRDDFRIHQAMGATYVRWRKFSEALASTDIALRNSGGAEWSETYATRSLAYSGLGRPAEAEVCARIAVLTTPKFYVARHAAIVAHPLLDARCSKNVDSGLIRRFEASEALGRLVTLGGESPPRGAAAVPLANAAFDFAALLTASDWPQTARKYRGYAMEHLFAEVKADCAKGPEPCFDGLAQLSATDSFEQAGPEVRATTLDMMAEALADAGQFSHAADYVLRLAAMRPPPKTVSLADTIHRLRYRALASVSFDPANGTLRERDPLDFLEEERMVDLGFQENYVLRDDRMERARSGASSDQALALPYGATSASEDSATMGTVLFTAGRLPNVKAFLLLAIENNIAARNLELPVKLMVGPMTARVMSEVSPRTGKTLGQMLTEAMEAEDVPPIPATTRDVFEAAEKLATLQAAPAAASRR